MTIAEITSLYNRYVPYLQSWNNHEALFLCEELHGYLHFHPEEIRNEVCILYREFLLYYATTLLNEAQLLRARNIIGEYERWASKQRINEGELLYYISTKVLLLQRLGHQAEAHAFLDEQMEYYPKLKENAKLIWMKAQMETEMDYPCHEFSVAAEALGAAEANNDIHQIAVCYLELAKTIILKYPALAVYFTHKAEILLAEFNDDVYLSAKLDRALCNYYIYQMAADKNAAYPFLEETQRLLKEVEPQKYKTPFLYNYYLLRKGLIEEDTASLLELLNFYQKVKALGEVCRVCDILTGIYINKQDWEEARRYNSLYIETASRLYKNDHIEKAKELRDILLEDSPNIVYNPFQPIPNTKGYWDIMDVLESIAIEQEKWALVKTPLSMLFAKHEQEGKCELVNMEDGTSCPIPLGLSPYTYFRGQSKFHEECLPSIFRGLAEEELFAERVRYAELKLLIDKHPITQMFRNGYMVNLPDGTYKPVSLRVDHLALAQHYGVKTELMDFTSDKFIAAFFATTNYNAVTDIYSPVVEAGEGVFYIYQVMPGMTQFRPVGIQPFARPGEQNGWVLSMSSEDNLNDMCHSVKFRHNANASRLISNYVNRGKKLFPYDALEEKAKVIKDSKVMSEAAFHLAKQEYYADVPEEILGQYLERYGLSLQVHPIVEFTEDEKREILEGWNNGGEQRFLDKVEMRFVSIDPTDS